MAQPDGHVRLLAEHHHGALPTRLPETSGTVGSLRTVDQAQDRDAAPVPGSTVLTFVRRPGQRPPTGRGGTVTGFLVELDVDTDG